MSPKRGLLIAASAAPVCVANRRPRNTRQPQQATVTIVRFYRRRARASRGGSRRRRGRGRPKAAADFPILVLMSIGVRVGGERHRWYARHHPIRWRCSPPSRRRRQPAAPGSWPRTSASLFGAPSPARR
jgi:hypothetical protein